MKAGRGTSTRNKGAARGFTLIEIVIVMTLTILLLGSALGFMVFSTSSRKLRVAAGEVERLAKRARTMAMLHQTSYALVISSDGVHMMTYAQALQPPGTQQDPGDGSGGVHEDWIPDDDELISVKRWSSDNMVPVDDKHPQVWRFDKDGVCEPLTIHIQRNSDFIEDEFHPLTASVHYTTMEARN